jgi:hypothetical protein
MSVPRTVAEVLREHVTLQVEGIDRMYLNVYMSDLQREQGVVWFLRHHRGYPFASSALMDPISKAFVAGIETFVKQNDIPLLSFVKGQRKDDVAAPYRAAFTGTEGVLFVGRAQEKTSVFRTEKRTNPTTGKKYPWIVRSTAMVNHYYFYGIDEDFGPFFLKFCSYFPYNAKLCINGHEYVKRQLAKEGIAYEALDNGILSCADSKRLQQLCDGLSADKIDALLRKWLARLPHPFTAADRAAGYRYEISILQSEFSLTQVLDRPLTGRIFFEEVIRENLDIGRPDQVQLIFGRRISKETPGRFRTRVLTEGVTPSLHIDYKGCRIKQYHKEGRALRTETTIHNARDFGTHVGKRLHNLPVLRQIGFQANRRLLDVQRISQDCAVGEEEFRRVTQPLEVQGQRASALRYADSCVLALLSTLLVFRLLPRGFANHELREHLAPLLGKEPSELTQGRMTYQLRRLRLHGLIVRLPGTHRYEVTQRGLRIALFFTRSYARVLRPGMAQVTDMELPPDTQLRHAADQFEAAMNQYVTRAKLTQET